MKSYTKDKTHFFGRQSAPTLLEKLKRVLEKNGFHMIKRQILLTEQAPQVSTNVRNQYQHQCSKVRIIISVYRCNGC